MQKYRQKGTFEAVKVTDKNIEEVKAWYKANSNIQTSDEWIEAYVSKAHIRNQYIILNEDGLLWKVRADIFETEYEPIN